MRAFKVFIFGLLYGWFLKMAFDIIFRDNEFADIRHENVSMKEYILSLESQLQSRPREARAMQSSAPQAIPVEAPIEAEIDLQAEPKAAVAPAPPPPASPLAKDNLKLIKGIGPAIERKLNTAGITTFAALARLGKRDLETILGSQINRLQDENDLIAQAKKLAKKR
jgi:predicted flap endonuclease-1-like 5' DNA nuclease